MIKKQSATHHALGRERKRQPRRGRGRRHQRQDRRDVPPRAHVDVPLPVTREKLRLALQGLLLGAEVGLAQRLELLAHRGAGHEQVRVGQGLELVVGEGRGRGAEQRDDLVVGVGDGARRRRSEEREGESGAAALAGEEASAAAAAAAAAADARGRRSRGARRRDEACVFESQREGGKERGGGEKGCEFLGFGKGGDGSGKSFRSGTKTGSRRAAAAAARGRRVVGPRVPKKLLRVLPGALASAPQRASVCGESECVPCASRGAARFEGLWASAPGRGGAKVITFFFPSSRAGPPAKAGGKKNKTKRQLCSSRASFFDLFSL